MTRAPDLTAIHAVELKVAQSRQKTLDSLRRVPVAFRATLARPSTIAVFAGAAGLLGFWIARRPQPVATSHEAGVARIASTAFLVRAFVVRYGMDHLPFILRQVWAAWQKRVV
jgi:hypothetical protein